MSSNNNVMYSSSITESINMQMRMSSYDLSHWSKYESINLCLRMYQRLSYRIDFESCRLFMQYWLHTFSCGSICCYSLMHACLQFIYYMCCSLSSKTIRLHLCMCTISMHSTTSVEPLILYLRLPSFCNMYFPSNFESKNLLMRLPNDNSNMSSWLSVESKLFLCMSSNYMPNRSELRSIIL